MKKIVQETGSSQKKVTPKVGRLANQNKELYYFNIVE